nr:hypothetical protein [Tanacetum cinerariifolium]
LIPPLLILMTSFGYRLNPRYAIKECLSCGALYTGDFCCSKGNVEDKILVHKHHKNCARCAKCGHPVNGPYYQGCTLLQEKLEEDLVTYFQNFQNTFESSNDSTNFVNVPREPFVVKKDHGVNPPHIDECSCECGNTLDGIFCQQCTYYTIAITPVLSTEEPDNSLSKGDEHLDTISATESDEVIKSSVENLIPIPSESEGIPEHMCDVPFHDNSPPLDVSKDQFEDFSKSNDEFSSTDDDSFSIDNIDYVEASPPDSELVSSEVMKIVIPEVGRIDDDILLTIKDDNLHKKLLNVRLLIANIEALKDNPAPSSEFLAKSSSTSPKSFLEETNTFYNSLPKFENFCFDLEEINSGSTTTHSYVSLSEYDSFIFDLANDQFPPTDRNNLTHEEFADELAHIISPPEYDCFYFRNLPDPSELMSILNFGIRKNLPSTTRVNLPVEDDYSPLLTYVVWIFFAYLTYPVIPPYLHSFGNEDTIFDPGITINRVYSFKPGLSHQCGTFKKFNTHRSHLNECPMIINGKNTPILDVLRFHFYPP